MSYNQKRQVPGWVGAALVFDAPVVGLAAGAIGSALWGAVVGVLWVAWVLTWAWLETRRR